MLPQAVSDHYRAQQRLVAAVLLGVRREWLRMGDDFDASWRRVGPRLVALVAAAQVGAASDGAAYVPAALDEQDLPSDAVDQVDPRRFAGVATSLDGLTYGSLDGLLYGAVVHSRTATAETLPQRLAAGQKWLEVAVHTQVADAAREASGAALVATPNAGWVRMVNPPCCQRCAVLAGAFYRSNRGFERHPGCDCRHIPASESTADGLGIVIGPDDVKDLTKSQRQAIGDGADMNQVINSHRVGSRSKDLMTTTEGATRRGIAGKRLGAERGKRAARLTPKGIYAKAKNRDEALELLRTNGYLL